MAVDATAAGFKGILTNALYDTWWHGGFRTAPYFHNSIGILTEASSARILTPSSVTREQLGRSGTRGMRSAMEATTNFPDPWPGGTWHPHDIMQMELIACHSVLSLAANYRADYLRNFFELGKANLSGAFAAGAPIAYLIPAGQGRDENLAKMIGTLVAQGVEVYRLDREVHAVSGEQSLRRTSPSNRTIVVSSDGKEKEAPAGSYIIFLNQPYRQNALALFEPQIYPDRTTATGEAERPYDVAGWTLPLTMGVESPVVLSIREADNDTGRISDKGFTNLAHFVEDGGTLICFDGSCGQLIRQWKLPLRNALEGLRSSDFYCPGSILRLDVDTTNQLARSLAKDTDAYFINSSGFETTDRDKVHVIARYAKDEVLRSGWLRGEDKIKDKIALAEITMGKGRIVLFAFRPQHRGQTWGTFPFIWNAINLAP